MNSERNELWKVDVFYEDCPIYIVNFFHLHL